MDENLINKPVEGEQVETEGEIAPEKATDETRKGEKAAGEAQKEIALAKTADEAKSERPAGPKVTFMGNTYDLMSMGALATAAFTLLSCLTCNMTFYCLPFLPLILGLVGLLQAREAVDEKRTRLWSWLGIGGGGVALLLMLLGIITYIGLIVVAMVAEGRR